MLRPYLKSRCVVPITLKMEQAHLGAGCGCALLFSRHSMLARVRLRAASQYGLDLGRYGRSMPHACSQLSDSLLILHTSTSPNPSLPRTNLTP